MVHCVPAGSISFEICRYSSLRVLTDRAVQVPGRLHRVAFRDVILHRIRRSRCYVPACPLHDESFETSRMVFRTQGSKPFRAVLVMTHALPFSETGNFEGARRCLLGAVPFGARGEGSDTEKKEPERLSLFL